jgi:hypothetical protein
MPSIKAVDCYSCATHILHRFARGYTRASAQQTITVTPRDSKHKVSHYPVGVLVTGRPRLFMSAATTHDCTGH